jgi:hypothetical protein
MPATTRTVGIVLMLIGIGSYLLTGRTSVTALIPAFFGVIFVVLAYAARNEATRKHVMHAAVALALVGALASLGRAIPAAADGQLMRPAVLAQIITALVLGFYVVMGVQSFIAARRARKG